MSLAETEILKMARAVQADECRKSFFYFVKTFWDVIIPETPVFNWHIPYLCEELQELSGYIVRREKNRMISLSIFLLVPLSPLS